MDTQPATSGPNWSRFAEDTAGWLLFGMLVFAVLRVALGDVATWIGGSAAWLAAFLLWSRVTGNQRIQIICIVALGILLGLWGSLRGTPPTLEQALGQNQTILAMLAAVSFLKLVNRPMLEGERIPAGRGAFLRTLLGLHLFGAAINITAMTIVADRLAAQSRFGTLQASMISRSFCLSVMYSPFIGGMGLALALAPGSRLEILAAAGIPFAAFGLWLTWFLLNRSHSDEIRLFKGYPIHLESLWIPMLLAVCVALLHRLWPELSVLVLISVSAPLLVGFIVLSRDGIKSGTGKLTRHVRHTLPDMSGELLLFLGAGVLAAGLGALFSSFGNWTPFEVFDGYAASITLTTIVAMSIVGVHPIVCVSFLAPLLSPISPEPNLMALVFIIGWAIGCTISPFSGTNLTMQGRYGVRNWSTTAGNLGYTALMLPAGCVLLMWFAHAHGS